jgi:hypothetical protein
MKTEDQQVVHENDEISLEELQEINRLSTKALQSISDNWLTIYNAIMGYSPKATSEPASAILDNAPPDNA